MEISALQQRLSQYPEIVAAYLYGSIVTNKMNPMSDVDVAILLQEQTPRRRELSISFHIISAVQEIFHREGDVKVLNRIKDLPFLHEVLSKGKLIYERVPAINRSFVAETVIAYLDFKPAYEIALRNYARSLKRGKFQHHS
ncbi:MAG: type VII toxin-antitoxin system MntA family adenylyltransferase antitoxin [bacterium]